MAYLPGSNLGRPDKSAELKNSDKIVCNFNTSYSKLFLTFQFDKKYLNTGQMYIIK